ncbi:tRNA-dihydrouridine synthase family protein [Aspergillus clavatus NRRL 1]|uniref:tRNA-dihydrouridine(16/17) synthase [NAD(P)(+)] n=1 Tax=Aspergillus clavatus (strain ATCC 1007 / CBS 513.65 / DSM 816 / NCTC 3887 / NRRL 1 / QM 1276 / 107) TaxID=344612 RepID=A1CNH9_ASPCL|nr:dihydrouridine synthase family protein, putative [Aspergillus clavatus NRRL 1]EAW07200.1 dihydrouridine synthase family protein, putative [Aspergillus clavatus NRRL 1]
MAVSETQPAPQPSAEAQIAPVSANKEARKKLFGREFYESIGSPKYIVAPMVDRSEFAWRMLTRSFMPADDPKPLLSYSPMYHARLFREQPNVRWQHFQPTRAGINKNDNSSYLDGNPAIDRPLFVQFCANDPDDFIEAARHVAPYCDAVDLNLGCPQGIARKGHYGAFLQEDWDLIYKLINRLHKELSIPVTAKFRIQESKEKTLEYAKMILSAGASIITLHGRTREQKGHNTGLADWSYIRYLRDNLPPETVIFANGNNLNHDDLERCLEATGADGVMSAEGNLSDPAIFSKPPPVGTHTREYWRGKDGKGGYRIDAIVRRYLDIIYKYVLEVPVPERKPLYLPSDPKEPEELSQTESGEAGGEDGPPRKRQKREKSKRHISPSLGVMQGHLFQVLRPMVAKHTDARDALARSRPGDMEAFEHTLTLVEQAIKKGLDEYEQFPERFEEQPSVELKGSKATIAEYGRPWWVCQPHIRPLPEEALENGALRLKKKDLVEEDKPKNGSIEPTAASDESRPASLEPVETKTQSTTDRLVSG